MTQAISAHRRGYWLTLLAGLALAGCGGISQNSVPLASSPSTRVPTPSPPATIWRGYVTSVLPNTQIAFSTPSVGWVVTGIGVAPALDNDLVAGVTGQIWPGRGLARTTDGGTSWQTTLQAAHGIWGVDPVSANDAWAVGVTTLYRTVDGGSTWTSGGEPTGTHLVAVAFNSPADGLGLTSDGSVVYSTDGGLAWKPDRAPVSASGPFYSLCARGSTFLASGASGAVWQQNSPGGGWQSAFVGIQSGGQGTFSMLTCSTTGSAWEAIEPVQPGAAGGSVWVVDSPSAGSPWSLEAGPNGTGPVRPPSIVPAMVAVNTPRPVLVGGTTSTSTGPGLFLLSSAGSFVNVHIPHLFDGTVPNLGLVRGAPTILSTSTGPHLDGLSFTDSTDGWASAVAEVTISGTPTVLTTIYSTTDGGADWVPISQLPN